MKIRSKAFVILFTFFFTQVFVISNLNIVHASTSTISNDYLEFAVADNGRFTVGTTGGDLGNPNDNNKIMLYGHPIPGTSYTTIKVDGNDYIYSPATTNTDFATLSNTSTYTVGNVVINQKISIVKNSSTQKEDTVEIKYTATNNDSVQHEVGTRIMMDTMLGSNDAAPFRIPGIGAVTTEKELTGSDIPEYWQAFDDLLNPTVIAQGTLLKGDNKPDKVQFTNWRRIYNTNWDYTVDPTQSNGDSAVSVYWNPKSLAAGETREYTTYYGISQFQQDLRPPLALSVTGANNLEVINGSYNPNPFAVTAYITNIGSSAGTDVKATINLPAGLSLANGQSATVALGTLQPNQDSQVSWNVQADPATVDRHLTYSIVLESSNSDTKTINRDIYIPSIDSGIDSLSINPNAVTLAPGQSKQLTVTGTKSSGNVVDLTQSTSGTTYSSSNTNLVTVNENGLISIPVGAANGVAYVRAYNNGKVTAATVTISSQGTSPSGLTINPTTVTLGQGETQQLTVTGTMPDGSIKDVTNSSTGTTYTSSNTAVATVDANGLITVLPAATVGYKTLITAQNGGKVVSCTVTVGSASVTVNSISLDTTAATLAQGATKQLLVTGTMSDGSTKDLTNSSTGTTYTSSNTSVATVDTNGLITVLPTATVGYKTVILANNNGKTASCTVTVGSSVVTVNSISLDTTAATLAQIATKQLVVTGTMSDGSTKDLTSSSTGTTYTSSNLAVATVDANGLITVLPTAIVGYKTVILANNNGKTASCTVTVGSAAVTVNSISLDTTAATLAQGATKQLVVTGTMSDGSTKDITNSSEGTTYTSSNSAVATVDANGLITVLPTATVGYKTVILANNNGKTASCTVTVGSAAVTVNSISLDTTAATLAQGATKQLVVTGTMSDGSTKDITNSSTGTTYTSSNASVATVDANGLITVLPTATVGYKTVISAKNNGKTASCTVTVGSAAVTVNSISLDATAATIGQGVTKQLVVTGVMSDGSTQDITNSSTGTTYTSSNLAVATVDANGLITVLPPATVGYKTVITAKNNGKTASCTVTVGSGAVTVNSISLDTTAATIVQGATKQLVVTGTMSDGSTKDVTNSSTGTTYTSSNTAVATVDANGLITVLPTATVGYKTVISVKNNGKTASCTVTVGSAVVTVNSISLDTTAATIVQGATKQLVVTGSMSDGSTKDLTNSSTGTTYTSSNTAVATVDANGLVTVLPTATVGYKTVISAKNNGKTVSCTVTVGSTGVAVNSISLDSTAVAIGQGLTKQLIVTGAMSDGSTKDITNSSTGTIYTSSNLAVATVDANGLITVSPTAISGYKTVITVKNGTKTASCTVTAGISGPTVTSISANLSTVTLAKGATQQLNVTATMSDSSTKDVTNSSTGTTYASSNTAVATVDANGLITILPTATSGYKCNITINNNGKIITCTVTVAP